MITLVLLCFSDHVLLLLLLLLLLLHTTAASSSTTNGSTLELTVGLRISPALASTRVLIPGFQNTWFLPMLSSPRFLILNSSDFSHSPGFSFGFLFTRSYDVGIYLAVCGGFSGRNFSTDVVTIYGTNDSNGLEAPYARDGYAVPVWIANPFTSLTSVNASLVVAATQQLQLQDLGGSVLWSVSNAVGLMEMLDTGTLTVYDTVDRRKAVWQSPSRDTLFRGEKLGVGMHELTNNDSSYSARMERGGLVLYLNTLQFMGVRPAPYWAIPALLSPSDNPLNGSSMVMSSPANCSGPAYALLDDDFSLNIGLGPANCSVLQLKNYHHYFDLTFDAGPLSFVKLENDGLLRIYAVPMDLAAGTQELPIGDSYFFGDISLPILQVSIWDRFRVPYACGRLGVCTPGVAGPCTCPLDDSFRPIDENDYSKGCTRKQELPSCTTDHQAHVHTTDFLQLNHTATIFLFSGWLFNSTATAQVETCKAVCSSNCSCNGFFYQANKSACFFITDEMSLLNLTRDYHFGGNLTRWPVDILTSDYVTFLKKVKAGDRGSPSASPAGLGRGTLIAIAIASSFAACAALAMALLLYSRARKRRLLNKQARQAEEELREVLPLLPSRFSYQDLDEATQGFSKILGAGGCGSVYSGTLQDGRKVAVKTLEFSMKNQTKQFLAEVATIGQTSHHNIVRLVGFCWEASIRMLVYEYMERGSLDHWLFHKCPPTAPASSDDDGGAADPLVLMDWQTRYNVVLGIVRGLSYLHEECPQPILHFDIKPQNILLDGAFVAKLADFGMSRLMQRDASQVVTGLRGTPGYIAPEWFLHGAVSKKGDIYSLGMVMLEIVGGRRNVDLGLLMNIADAGLDDQGGNQLQHEAWHFPSWAARKCEQGLEMELVDTRLQYEGQFNEAEARRLIYTAFWCIQEDPAMRPYAPTALQWLEGSGAPVKKPPFSSTSHGASFSDKPSSSSRQFSV